MEREMKVLTAFLMLIAASTPLYAENVLRGSPASLARQNRLADEMDLVRLNEELLPYHQSIGNLIEITEEHFRIHHKLPVRYRWCRTTTLNFLVSLSLEFQAIFGLKIQVNSAVRTIEYQRKLQKINANAARGDTLDRRSAHLTGAVVDIGKKGMTREQLMWMRKRLTDLEKSGLIEATEEFNQLVFHVMVIDWLSWPVLPA